MDEPASWGLDLGFENLRAVKLRRNSGRVEVQQYLEIPLNPPITEETPDERAEIYTEAFKRFREQADLQSSDSVSLAISGLEGTSVPIQIPPEVTDIEAFIEQKIYRNFLFETGDTVIRYQVLPTDKFDERRIFVITYPPSAIQRIIQAARSAEIQLTSLQPSPSALINFLRFEFRDLEKTLVINFRTDSTDMLFGTEAGIWYRSMDEGGTKFRRKLRYEFGVPRNEAGPIANDLFRGVPRTPYTIACDEFFERVQSEIQRALDFQALHASFTQPSKVFILGECSKLPGALTHLSNRFHCWVERLEKSQRVFAEPSVVAKAPYQNINNLGVAIGAGLKGVGAGPQPMNFGLEIPKREISTIAPQPRTPSVPVEQPAAPTSVIESKQPKEAPAPATEAPAKARSLSGNKVWGVLSVVAVLLTGAFAFNSLTESRASHAQLADVRREILNVQTRHAAGTEQLALQNTFQELDRQRTALLSLAKESSRWSKLGDALFAGMKSLEKNAEFVEASFDRQDSEKANGRLSFRFSGEFEKTQKQIEQTLQQIPEVRKIEVSKDTAQPNRLWVQLMLSWSTTPEGKQ